MYRTKVGPIIIPYVSMTTLRLPPNLLIKIVSSFNHIFLFLRSYFHSTNYGPSLQCLFHMNMVYIDFSILKIHHNLGNKLFKDIKKNLKPSPSSSLGIQISGHSTQCLLMPTSLEFHRNLENIL